MSHKTSGTLLLLAAFLLLGGSAVAEPAALAEASRSWRLHKDRASLELLFRSLRVGMKCAEAEILLGEADYSPLEGQRYYLPVKPLKKLAQDGAKELPPEIVLVTNCRNEDGELTATLQDFWLGPVGE